MSTLSVQSIKDVQSFDFANTSFASAFGVANSGYVVANAAFTYGNSSYTVANAAFGRANTALQNTSGVFAGNLGMTGSLTLTGSVVGGSARTIPSTGGYFIDVNGINTDIVANGRTAAITGGWGSLRVHQAAGHPGLKLVGDTSQTANYMEVESSAGSTLFRINTNGNVLVNTSLSWAKHHIALTNGTRNSSLMNAGNVNPLLVLSAPFSNPELTTNAGAKWGMIFSGNGDFPSSLSNTKAAGIFAVSEDSAAGYNRKVGLALHSCSADGSHTERVRVDGDGKVGIGIVSPIGLFHIQDTSNRDSTGYIMAENTNTGTAGLTNSQILVKNRYGASQFMQWESNGLRIGPRWTANTGAGNIYITAGDDVTRMTIDSSGRVSMPYQPRFKAVFSTATDTSYTINTILPYNTSVYNVGTHYNTSTYRFTAPVAGYYYFRAWGYGTASAGARATMSIRLYKNGSQDSSTVTGDFNIGATAAGEVSIAGLNSYGTLYLNAGDYVEAYCTAYNNNSTFRIYTGHAGFEGYLLG